jgi:L-seryl-tRNA(Ser) seleniumtransferase
LNDLRSIPSVESLVSDEGLAETLASHPRRVVVAAVREILESERKSILGGGAAADRPDLIKRIAERVRLRSLTAIKRVVNATGVILHTNLGRAPMSADAASAMRDVAAGYCNLEYDLVKGVRTRRGIHAERMLAELAGSEDALVVNNNAAAVMLTLNSLADGLEVIVSRGELIEIGGSFRLPDIMGKSGARLVEVGTTNKTYLSDYEGAVSERTGLILKAHRSNYSIVGFSAEASLQELASLGAHAGIPVAYDLGSGALLDLGGLGPGEEPAVKASVAAGASVVSFSGDKLMGGPQAGLIVGRSEAIAKLRENPLARAFRVDKCFLAALERTLDTYLSGEWKKLPAVKALLAPAADLSAKVRRIKRGLSAIGPALTVEVAESESEAGGGSLPQHPIATKVIRMKLSGVSADSLAAKLRGAEPPVIPRIQDDWVVVDPRTVLDRQEEKWIVSAVSSAAVSREGGD